jgi:Ca2+-binding RTX toxin-like protein
MRRKTSSWSTTLSKLGFRRKRIRSSRQQGTYRRQPSIESLEPRHLLSITVNTLVDENNGINTGGVSLRDAVAYAATLSGPQTIDFAPSLSGGTIELTHGSINVASDVTIQGLGTNDLTIDAQGNDRVLYVDWGKTVSISGLTLTGGGSVDIGAGIWNNGGDLTLENVSVSGNSTTSAGNGGGIYSFYGSLRLFDSTIDNNHSPWNGGIGFWAVDTGDVLEISGSTISDNTGSYSGGLGIFAFIEDAHLTITNSTISSNTATVGIGGLGVYFDSHLLITNSTITKNSGYDVGGVFVNDSTCVLTLQNSIIADNVSSLWDGFNEDVGRNAGTFDSASSYNLIGKQGWSGITGTTANHNQVGTQSSPIDPGLAPLGDYGGSTKSHALVPESLAIDSGSDSAAVNRLGALLTYDQRGIAFERIVGDSVDIGATEAHVIALADGAIEVYGTTADDAIDMTTSQVSISTLGDYAFLADLATAPTIRVFAGSGSDHVAADTAIDAPVFAYGEAGNDTLGGGSGDDYLNGGEGVNSFTRSLGNDKFVYVQLPFAALTLPDKLSYNTPYIGCFSLDAQQIGTWTVTLSGGTWWVQYPGAITPVYENNSTKVTLTGTAQQIISALASTRLTINRWPITPVFEAGNLQFDTPNAAWIQFTFTQDTIDLGNGAVAPGKSAGGLIPVPVDLPPSLTLDLDNSSGAPAYGYARDFIEGDSPVAITDSDAKLVDWDDNNVASMSVGFRSGDAKDGGLESLTATGTSNIHVVGNGTQSLTLTGVASVAEYQSVLRSIKYSNTSSEPTEGIRRIWFFANDGVSESNEADAYVNVRQFPTPRVITRPDGSIDVYGTPASEQITITNSGVTFGQVNYPAAIGSATVVHVFARGGNDVVVAQSLSRPISLYGEAGDDTLVGGGGNDILSGGGGGNDLQGAAGDDTYAIDDRNSATNTIDDISGIDTIDMSNWIGPKGAQIDLSASVGAYQFVSTSYFNSQGSSNTNLVALTFEQFESIENVIGTPFNDTLMGNSKNNVIASGGGEAWNAGAGDHLEGGAGDDTYVLSNRSNGTIIINDTSGVDTIDVSNWNGTRGATIDLGMLVGAYGVVASPYFSSQGTSNPYSVYLTLDQFESIENVNGTAFDDTITGNSKNNTIFGNGGADTIHGAAGDDVLSGGDGEDILYGEAGNNILHGGSAADILYGDVGIDWLFGDDGNDTLFGYEGADLLNGGKNDDTLYGGPGPDVYQVTPGDEYLNDLIIDDDGPQPVQDPSGHINHRPEINPTESQHIIQANSPFSLTLGASDSDADQTLTFSAVGALPSGSSFASGVFTWTPTQANVGHSYTITFQVSDNGTPTLTDQVTVTLDVTQQHLPAPTDLSFRSYAAYTTWIQFQGVKGLDNSIINRYRVESRSPGGEWTFFGYSSGLVQGQDPNNSLRLFSIYYPGNDPNALLEYHVAAVDSANNLISDYSLPFLASNYYANFAGPANTSVEAQNVDGGVQLTWDYEVQTSNIPAGNLLPVRVLVQRRGDTETQWETIDDFPGNTHYETSQLSIWTFYNYTDVIHNSNPNITYQYRVLPYNDHWRSQYESNPPLTQLLDVDTKYLQSQIPTSLADTGIYIGLNRDYDEGNTDGNGNSVPDYAPDHQVGDRIFNYPLVPPFGLPVYEQYRNSNLVEAFGYSAPGPDPFPFATYSTDKLDLWQRDIEYDSSTGDMTYNGYQKVNYGDPLDSLDAADFLVEGIAPSVTKGDTYFTLTSNGQSKTTSATVVNMELSFDGLTENQENKDGVLVQRNSDFSKKNVADLTGTPIPDYEKDGLTDDYQFDLAGYQTDYTPATLTWNANVQTDLNVLLTFNDNILVWDVTDWDHTAAHLGDIHLIKSGQAFSTTHDHLNLMIEGLKSSDVFASDMISAAFVRRDFPWYKIVEDTARYTVVDINALVDGDRNGKLEADKSGDRSLTFWYNSDRDGTYEQDNSDKSQANPFVQADANIPPGQQYIGGYRDGDSINIHETRDLEDFAPLSLYVDPLLKSNSANIGVHFLLKDNGGGNNSTRLRIFNTLTGLEADSRQFLNDSSISVSQTTDAGLRLEDAQAVGTAPDSTNTLYSQISAGLNSYIFEAVPPQLDAHNTLDTRYPENAVELVFDIQITYGSGITKTIQSSVKLDLHDITDFYDTYVVDHDDLNGNDLSTAVSTTQNISYGQYHRTNTAVVNDMGGQNPNGFNNNDYILFVHGWNMDSFDKKSYAETTFKRLYWQGYSGRFGTLDWPTFINAQGPHTPDFLIGGEAANLTYNASELQAWRSGEALKNVISSLRHPDESGNVHVNVIAHSMGNVVASEALRLWRGQNSTALVDTYVAMEGAVSAGIYGDDDEDGVSPPQSFSPYDLYRFWPTGHVEPNSTSKPYIVGSNPSSNIYSAANKRVNFYNKDDYALAAWKANNLAKPIVSNDFTPPQTWAYQYAWIEDANNVVTDIKRIDALAPSNVSLLAGHLVDQSSGGIGATAYEALAFASQSNSKPIGTKIVSWFSKNVNIQTLGMDASAPGLAPDSRQNHSFQFLHDQSTTWRFWQEIKDDIGFTSTFTA